MGVKDLYKIIEKYASDIPKKHPLSYYAGKKLIIDASIYMYKWSHIKVLENINHIQGVFYQASMFKLAGIEPIYAFDGAPSAAKSSTIAARIAKIERLRLPRGAARDCQRVLELLGVDYFIANGEAETAAAGMVARGEAYGIVSDDSDCLVYPGSVLLRLKTERNKQYIVEYSHIDIASGLGLTSEQFINLCVLLGTDYNAPILPPKRAISAAMDPIMSQKLLASDEPIAALEIFNIHPNNVDVNIQTTRGHFDKEQLRKYLLEVGMVPNRIDNTLSKLSEKLGVKGANAYVNTDVNIPRHIILSNLYIHGYSRCKYFDDAVKLIPSAIIVEVSRAKWGEHVSNLNAELHTNHKTSPYIFAVICGKKIFIGGYDNLKEFIRR